MNRKRKTSKLTDFFSVGAKQQCCGSSSEINPSKCVASNANELNTSVQQTTDVSSVTTPLETRDLQSQPQVSHVNIKDISYLKKLFEHSINNQVKCDILINAWVPAENSDFPCRQIGGQNRKFCFSWLKRYAWLAYSQSEDSAYCKVCMVFAPEEVGMTNSQNTGQLIKMGFCGWKKAIERFEAHQNTTYHCQATLKADDFLKIMQGKKDSIDKSIDKSRSIQAAENRAILKPIIDTVILCGRQNIPLRGHSDYGEFDLSTPPVENEGNFRALLREKVKSGDEKLRKHFELCGRNAMYISWNIQNQIIDACNDIITSTIVREVNNAKCFSVLADETTDISCTEQCTLCLRYVKCDSSGCYTLQESFLQFLPLEETTGKNIADTLLQALHERGIDCSFLRGQGYDGAASMSGKFKGTQSYISEQFPKALYVHCSSHCLNLAISNSSEVASIRNCFGTIRKLYDFFATPKRQIILQQEIASIAPDSQKNKLKQLCATRWVERHEAVMVVVQLLQPVAAALEEITEWKDKDTSSNAFILLNAIRQPDFIVALLSAEKLLSYTLPLSKKLQATDVDLASALSYADDIISVLTRIRENAETEFKSLFRECEEAARNMGSQITTPRLIKGRQVHRANVAAENSEEYFRRAVFIPWTDGLISNLRARFTKHKDIIASFVCLLPSGSRPSKESTENFIKLADFYKTDLDSAGTKSLISELELWYNKFQCVKPSTSTVQESPPPKNAIDALNICDHSFFPNVHVLLKIFSSLPVSTSTSERSFSTLRRIKNYLRNTTSDSRLNGLANLNIHREIPIDQDEVVDILVRKGPRRLNFVL